MLNEMNTMRLVGKLVLLMNPSLHIVFNMSHAISKCQ